MKQIRKTKKIAGPPPEVIAEFEAWLARYEKAGLEALNSTFESYNKSIDQLTRNTPKKPEKKQMISPNRKKRK